MLFAELAIHDQGRADNGDVVFLRIIDPSL
jgi:hypothetical protein